MSDDCLFCKIIAKEIPGDIVAEDDLTLAFRDIAPEAPTHVLVVPKLHIDHAGAIRPTHADTLAAMFVTAQRVADVEGITPDGDDKGYRLVLNVGKDAQNSVGHLHMHVLGGRKMNWPPG